eukprot:CAMPEP_0174704698 /NCGR_PEP_ID=MMETSP1094-20130205/8193_1 /TAXON_ID=156173 /ORGANISM="Chrysochromulina brevifilum, Strain UTEX LB 985" /LENGTH=74 /DNA_ID=CAMNT_0015902781 /DNA_START=308 /DNA_END=532 /DNA_ORIENTATION=-
MAALCGESRILGTNCVVKLHAAVPLFTGNTGSVVHVRKKGDYMSTQSQTDWSHTALLSPHPLRATAAVDTNGEK